MEHWKEIILGLFLLTGVIGTFIPVVPGTGIILAGALLHALLTDFSPISGPFLLLLGLLFLAAQAGQYVVTAMGSKRFGSSKYGIMGAGLGMLAGIFLPVPGGIFLGAFGGAFIFELCFAFKDLKESFRAGTGALLGTILSLFFEFFVALLMAGLVIHRLFVV